LIANLAALLGAALARVLQVRLAAGPTFAFVGDGRLCRAQVLRRLPVRRLRRRKRSVPR